MKQTGELEITTEEYERLSEIAHRRLPELGFSEDDLRLILGSASRTKSGVAPDKWNEEKGTVFAATASKDRIQTWLWACEEREEAQVAPWDRPYIEQ